MANALKIADRLLLGPLNEASNLWHRYQESTLFHKYVMGRLLPVVWVGVLIAVNTVAAAAGTVLFLGGTRSLLVLLAFLTLPLVVLGSLFVQVYVFLSWLENRAIAKTHNPPRRAELPSVPWLFTAVFFALPLGMLSLVMPGLAGTLVVLTVLAPVLFAAFDR